MIFNKIAPLTLGYRGELSTDSGNGLNGLSARKSQVVGEVAEEEAVGAEEEEKKGIWGRVRGWFGR